ncbi:protein FIZZY-RELATED 3-like [Miscanthus floridulus]|uniref:protein FIZZY-RELATED 3-like n=1 Tax=Miscanthus floridulus TaxID=154761 RepID=UPI0034581463
MRCWWGQEHLYARHGSHPVPVSGSYPAPVSFSQSHMHPKPPPPTLRDELHLTAGTGASPAGLPLLCSSLLTPATLAPTSSTTLSPPQPPSSPSPPATASSTSLASVSPSPAPRPGAAPLQGSTTGGRTGAAPALRRGRTDAHRRLPPPVRPPLSAQRGTPRGPAPIRGKIRRFPRDPPERPGEAAPPLARDPARTRNRLCPSHRLAEPPKTPSPSKTTYSDRFIPCRSSRLQYFALLDSPLSPAKDETPYSRLLRAELFGPDSSKPTTATSATSASPNTNLFRFKKDHSARTSPFAKAAAAAHHDFTAGSGDAPSPHKPPRKVPKTPHKVLDAPSLQDDFYLNLVDWSSQNVLAVGLGTCVYLWSASNSKVTKLCNLGPRDSVCGVHCSREGSYLSIGTGLGDVQIWDSSRCKRIRNMGGHQTRTGVLPWSSCILSSGSRDKNILQHDIRVPSDYISKFCGHRSEVCGLKCSHADRELASGGNDSQLLVWNQRSQQPVLRLTGHTAAVKAIAWSPHQQGLLASGGGTADRCIRFWNTANGNVLNSTDTGSQVCNLAWCKNVNDLVSTHGYSQNQIMVWKYPSMSKSFSACF